MVGAAAAYAISEIGDIDMGDVDMGDVDMGDVDMEDVDMEDVENNGNSISFMSKTPPNHLSDGYIHQGGQKYNGFDVYKKMGHTYYWNSIINKFVIIK